MTVPAASLNQSFAMLRRFAERPRPKERCEFCGKALEADHHHLIETAKRRIACACDACAIVLSAQVGTSYRRIPKRVVYLPDFQLSDAQWDSLLIPINIAFFYDSTLHGRTTAIYPSPAGATESLLDLDGWREIVASNPILGTMESDVEAFLVNRLRSGAGAREDFEHYIAPIDECFKLVGLIRTRWRGLSGGADVWQEIGKFFDSLRAKSQAARDCALLPCFHS